MKELKMPPWHKRAYGGGFVKLSSSKTLVGLFEPADSFKDL